MKLFFIGFAVDNKDAHLTKGVSIAGNNMQIGIINGLSNIINDDLKVFTIKPIAAFPKSNKIFIRKSIDKLVKKIRTLNIAFINLPIVKQLSIYNSLYTEVEKEIIKYKDENIILVVFNAVPFVSIAINKLANKYNLKSVCILADPPVDNIKRGFIGTYLRNRRDKKSENSIKSFDKLIVLNKNAANIFASKIPMQVIDCGIDIKDINEVDINKVYTLQNEKKIVFSGTIQEHSGIENLVKAMKLVKSRDVKLYIYGKGPMEKKIKQLAQGMDNIIFKGFVSYTEIRKIQSEAYLLVNPSKVSHPINKVAFPSKLMEYMISGTPVISNKLECIGNDYKEKIYFFNEDTPEAMADAINRLMDMDYQEYMKIALKARNFVIENKDWNIQSKKIYDFIRAN